MDRGGAFEVEGENVTVREGEEKTLAFLDVEVSLKLETGGRVAFETGALGRLWVQRATACHSLSASG